MSKLVIPETINLGIPDSEFEVVVTASDEGIIVDVLGERNQIIASTWRTYKELDLVKEEA